MAPSPDISAALLGLDRHRFALWLGLALAVPLTLVAISTFVLDSAIVPAPLLFVLFPAVAILHVMTIMNIRATWKTGGSQRSLLKQFPKWALIVFFAFWVSGMSGLLGSGNAATERNGRYIVNDHGVERAVTKAEAMRGNRMALRAASSILGIFSAVGLIVALRRPETDDARSATG